MSVIAILLVCLSHTPVTPLDAFRANLAATKADITFVFTSGEVSGDVVDKLRSWASDGVTLPETPETTITGRWTCDGAAEMLTCRHPAPKAATPSGGEGVVGQKIPPKALPAPSWAGFEVLCDGEVQAEHRLGEPDIQIHLDDAPGMALLGRGPFCWWGTYRFPATLKHEHRDQAPAVHRTTLSGYDVVAEAYQIDLQTDTWVRIEIYYDPSVGYLPRYVRAMGIAGGSALCRELYLVSARPCAAGGFVPTEFYEAVYGIAPPKHRAGDEFDDPFLPRPSRKVLLGHFIITDFKDFRGTAALEDLKGAHTVVGRGGWIPLVSKSPLTTDRIRSMLGRKLTDPCPSQMANLDIADLNDFTRKPRHGWGWALFIATPAAITALAVLWRKKRASGLVLLAGLSGFGSLSGCTPSLEADARLSATVDHPQIIYDPEQHKVRLSLIVRNAGNVDLKIFHADGGCECRWVDQSGLPRGLSPGATFSFGLDLSTPPSAEEYRFTVRFQTNHGDIYSPVSLVILARDSLNPEALASPTLNDVEGWEFEVVHRSVFDTEHPTPMPAVEVSPEFVVRQVHAQRGEVAIWPRFVYQDTKYLLTLKNKEFGLHEAFLRLKRPDGHIVRELPVVWRRVEYLSTVPDRALMGQRPVRVFLRCPDEGIELTRVLSTPEGIKAVVSSPRELTFTLGNGAPAVIDGVVEVGTTAKSRPPLRVSVVRFSISPAKN